MTTEKCETVQIAVVGTGSKGNAYLITAGESKLLLEAGVSVQKVRKFNSNRLMDIDALLVTHTHKDHAEFIYDYCAYFGDYVYGQDKHFDKFDIYFDKQHHDIPCYGYTIDFPEMGIMIHYVTDTNSIHISPKHMIADRLHYWICECDYTEETMQYNDEHESAEVALRNARTRETHLSDRDVIAYFRQKKVRADAVLFVHKSEQNFEQEVFCAEWHKELPRVSMAVAENGARFEMCGKRIDRVLI